MQWELGRLTPEVFIANRDFNTFITLTLLAGAPHSGVALPSLVKATLDSLFELRIKLP